MVSSQKKGALHLGTVQVLPGTAVWGAPHPISIASGTPRGKPSPRANDLPDATSLVNTDLFFPALLPGRWLLGCP